MRYGFLWLAGADGLSAVMESQELLYRFESNLRMRMYADMLNLDHAQYALRGRRVERARPAGNGGRE